MNKKTYKKTLFYLSFTTFFYYIVVGVALSIFSILLDKQEISTTLIGFSDSLRRLSGFAFLSFLPFLVHKIGFLKTVSTTVLTYSIALLIFPFIKNYYLWLALIIVFGASMMGAMTLLDSLCNIVATNDNRGKINGFVNTVILIAIAVAPFVIKYVENYKNLLIILSLISLCNIFGILYFYKLKDHYKEINFIKNLKLMEFFKKTPDIFLSKMFLEFFSNSLFIFTVVFTKNSGLTYEIGGKCLTLYCLFGLIASYFVGTIIEKSEDKNYTLKKWTIITLLLCFALKYTINSEILLYLNYSLLGISTDFLVLGSLITLDSLYKNNELVSANSVLTIFGSFAQIISGIITGYFINKYNSMILASCIFGIFYILYIIIIKIKKSY